MTLSSVVGRQDGLLFRYVQADPQFSGYTHCPCECSQGPRIGTLLSYNFAQIGQPDIDADTPTTCKRNHLKGYLVRVVHHQAYHGPKCVSDFLKSVHPKC
jgi:hypothetical protein